ncbi:MAG: hypothetical protein DMG57_12780 [Acidobacteria bacterium]|nr:MAG: hypothetical protein DMG57_12780 [Acidobacteriota bacterium]
MAAFSVSGVARAQDLGELPTINVSFALKEPIAINAVRSHASDFQRQLSVVLAEKLKSTVLDIWNFTGSQDPAAFPRLDISLKRHEGQWDIVINLETSASGLGSLLATMPLYPPEELDRCCENALPGEGRFRQDIGEKFEEWLLGGDRDAFLKALMHTVPLGNGIVPLDPPAAGLAFAVLPLRWDPKSPLASATFAVFYHWPQHGEVTLHSTSFCEPSDYTPQTKLFAGIKVRHDSFQVKGKDKEDIAQHLADLSQLQPLRFLLEAPPDVGDSCLGLGPVVAPQ